MINWVINDQDYENSLDINNDLLINVLDIIVLVNIILDSST